MKIDSKTLGEQDVKMLVRSLELVSARIFESVVTMSQIACSNTPEIHTLFNQWVACLGDEIGRLVEENCDIDPEEIAQKIGVSSSAIISLSLALHRQGKIRIKSIRAEPGDNINTEICDCFK